MILDFIPYLIPSGEYMANLARREFFQPFTKARVLKQPLGCRR